LVYLLLHLIYFADAQESGESDNFALQSVAIAPRYNVTIALRYNVTS